MSLRSMLLVLPLLAVACAAPASSPEDGAQTEMAEDDLTAGKQYVRITGTCFQSYDMKSLNTGASLGASRLVFQPGQEGKQFAFCAGTDRVVLRGSKTADGAFAVDAVWMQQSGATVPVDAEIVQALRLASGESFERPVSAGVTTSRMPAFFRSVTASRAT
jgi:hypothetical protein